MKAPLPPDESDRLKALHSFEILDTDPERQFDDVVQLASAVCGTPISLISLLDADRQWFKARVGTDDVETPIDQAICAHAILQEDFLEISDTTRDPATADNPLVTGEMHLRFYAGAVLRTSDGFPIGTLCVLDREPRELTPLQRDTLKVLARQVITQMELRQALRRAELMRREVDHRVKNSLQSVSALTRMQARYAVNQEVRVALDHVQRRIDTVAALHEQLYRAGKGGHVNLNEFTSNVWTLVGASAPTGVEMDIAVPQIEVEAATAAAIGVVMNEFASNAFKHAFPDGRRGAVSCRIDHDATSARMVLSDNGVGMKNKDGRASGLGLQVMEAAAQQLGGEFELDTGEGGTRIALRFDLAPEVETLHEEARLDGPADSAPA
ncbi:sensor histidine kinase [Pseudooceanicola aestuarii]|uniref:sensor histidine kinase n=1 Tax=Pseudooceanicola aestuarii TaxID=2697319 RepID=UPI0013D650A1|nr:histidine kinase dimerization/phosphoacceptor domain -containing protein [Pseudooceanicola aestuarii]